MKNSNALKELNFGIEELTFNEQIQIEGGSFWKDLAWAVGYGMHQAYDFVTNLEAGTALASPIGSGPNGAGGK